jgi:phosphoglycerol transferase
VGILDQTGKGVYFVPHYAAFQAESASDADLVKRIEATVPAGVMIFQLPYVPFPEGGPLLLMQDYDLFRPYLHSKNLRWSYGAIKDRDTASWQMATASLPADQFLETISLGGFSGVYIDRKGYADNAAALETKLRDLLGIEPLVSANHQMVFFDLGAYNTRLAAKYGGGLESERETVLNPLAPQWTKGFSGVETTDDLNWRWCSSEGELVINNGLKKARTIKVDMGLATGYEELANLTLDGDLVWEKLQINSKPTAYSKTLTIPPGRHSIRFTCDAKRVDAPLDKRSLVFKVMNFRLQEVK